MKSSVSLKYLSFYLADLGYTEDITWLEAGYVVTLAEKKVHSFSSEKYKCPIKYI